MNDRFTKGFIAGVIGGIVANAFSILAGVMGMTNLRTVDLIGAILYDYAPPYTLGEVVFALLGHLLISGAIGVTFAYFITRVSSQNLLFKGWFFSVTVWFSVYAITGFFQVPGTAPTALNTALTDFVATTLFGLVMTMALRKLTPEASSTYQKLNMVPAMKPLDQIEDDEENKH